MFSVPYTEFLHWTHAHGSNIQGMQSNPDGPPHDFLEIPLFKAASQSWTVEHRFKDGSIACMASFQADSGMCNITTKSATPGKVSWCALVTLWPLLNGDMTHEQDLAREQGHQY